MDTLRDRGVFVPYLDTVAGALWWAVGSSALDPGAGTVVLAAGLGVAGGLGVAAHRRHGRGVPLPRGGRGRLLLVLGVAVMFVAGVSTGLGILGFGELAVPASAVICGAAMVPLATLLDRRAVLAGGLALMVIGALGAFLALDSAGRTYPVGLVGFGAGAVVWLVAASRLGLLAEAGGRLRHR